MAAVSEKGLFVNEKKNKKIKRAGYNNLQRTLARLTKHSVCTLVIAICTPCILLPRVVSCTF